MFGVMLEGIVGSTPLVLPSSPSALMPMTSRGLGPLGRSHVHSGANGRTSARVTRSVVRGRKREKGDHEVASLGDSAKSPFAIAQGATPSFTCSLHRADIVGLTCRLAGPTASGKEKEASNSNLT